MGLSDPDSLPVTTVTVFHYESYARFQAFANMGRSLMKPFEEEGMVFCKLMGSGKNFGLVPDFSQYVFLAVWKSDAHADAFLQSATYRHLQEGTDQTGTLYLRTQRAHGHWDGQSPFVKSTQPAASDATPVAVLTRATIRYRALPDFWRHVPQARQRLQAHSENLLFGIGVGEVPLVQQCTISVWRTAKAVDQYAYREAGHREVVQRTRQRQWYSEELFARFSVFKAEGTLFTDIQRIICAI
ncbi:DUF3291 domain-containing protein [Spirosoma sp. RP8]|uniref:DUF3291 domain-containing protein n=1 Tax=Spirosoma liriopis TaxID=2937440 RepID=A0ABT0HHP0_9BACT|nr:DUF3291 domain-containing protein [Spirosoma liriopis]MCK8491673.1 DUF3291 domain-containing protein [Spirosoma liriopis]